MATDNQTITIEGFVADLAFIDRSKQVSDFYTADVGQVATLTSKVLSYFNTPVFFTDKRAPTARVTNWSPSTSVRVMFDNNVFGDFVTVLNNLPTSAAAGFFKLVDKLFFNYAPANTRPILEAALRADSDISSIYVQDSFSLSQTLLSDTVYIDGGTTKTVTVPSFVDLTLKLPSGTKTINFVIRLYTSVEAWLGSYNVSTIVKVIPPLPYDKLYDASLTSSTDNIFSTANVTASLNFTTTQALIGSVAVSGIAKYNAVITDGINKVSVPFNILYKGGQPTLFEIRKAIRQALADSGIGTEDKWRKRIPSVYVEGRFYVVPLWDQVYNKPNKVVYPNIAKYKDLMTVTNNILSSLGYGDLSIYLNVLTAYYNRMTLTAIPDLSGTVKISNLGDLIPDYQNCAPSDEQFGYMFEMTQDFTKELNTILAADSGVGSVTVYTPITEGPLSFYSFTMGDYEICVITKQCYTTIRGSIQ